MADAILVVDDDAAVCWAMERVLSASGFTVHIAADAAQARSRLQRHAVQVVITDLRMPDEDGQTLLAWVRREHPHLPVLVASAYGAMETVIETLHGGAMDFIPKPLDLDRVLLAVRTVLQRTPPAFSAHPLPGPIAGDTLVGSGAAMQEVFRRIAVATAGDLPVLISGESGTGKELVARMLHRHAAQRDGPFVAINCGALPRDLVESARFGHETAVRGTLFLDEVGDLALPAQVTLLRLLEQGAIHRIGGSRERAIECRLISSTHRDLTAMVRAGTFRADLYYRLRVFTIALPPLRDHPEDLPELVQHLLGHIATRLGRALSLGTDAWEVLRGHTWPGNIRELVHLLAAGAMTAPAGRIGASHLGLTSGEPERTAWRTRLTCEAQAALQRHPGSALSGLMAEVERALVTEALRTTGGNLLHAAALLGIHRTTLRRRLDELGLSRGESAAEDT